REWSSSARHGAIGVAISNVPEGERLSAVVSSSHGERSRCSQAHDRGLGTQATDRSVAVRVAGRCSRRRRFVFRTNIGGGLGVPAEFRPGWYVCHEIRMTVRGGGFPTSPLAFMPIGRMGPPLRSFAADAHDCIVVPVLGPTAYKVVARFNRARKRAPL